MIPRIIKLEIEAARQLLLENQEYRRNMSMYIDWITDNVGEQMFSDVYSLGFMGMTDDRYEKYIDEMFRLWDMEYGDAYHAMTELSKFSSDTNLERFLQKHNEYSNSTHIAIREKVFNLMTEEVDFTNFSDE